MGLEVLEDTPPVLFRRYSHQLPLPEPDFPVSKREYIYEPSPAGVLTQLVPRYIESRIYQGLRTPFDCHDHQLSSDASIGIATAPRDGTDLFDLLKNADLAMYAAKAAGRRTYRFFDPAMEQQANHRRELEADLRAALAQGAFELHYQPQVDLRSDRVTGCEALLRWRHPVRGMVSPADFVPVAEETGLIEEIGQWVLRTACAEAAAWPADVRIAVNVSPIQFRSETLSLKVAAVLSEPGLTRAGWSWRSRKPS
jgi:predicted signal transduction protein with EAL and GGDEF domain